jgi:hypothetical protein
MAENVNLALSQIKPFLNPAFTIENWKGADRVYVYVNATKADAITAREGNSLLVWIPVSLDKATEIAIRNGE